MGHGCDRGPARRSGRLAMRPVSGGGPVSDGGRSSSIPLIWANAPAAIQSALFRFIQGSDLQRSIIAVGPFTHGGVVVFRLVVTDQLEDEHTVRRTDPALSIRVDFLLGRDAGLRQDSLDFVGWLEPVSAPVHHVEPFQMNRPRNVPNTLVAPGDRCRPIRRRPARPRSRRRPGRRPPSDHRPSPATTHPAAM